MCEACILIRYETAVRPEEHRWPVWIDDQWDRIDGGLEWFNAHPGELEGPADLGHLALGCLLGYLDLRMSHRPWRERFAQLTQWYERLEGRPSFQQTRPGAVPPPPAPGPHK